MRLLANENFPAAAVFALRAAGHDVAWVHEDAAGSSDPDVLQRGHAEQRLLLTFDTDFGELVFNQGRQAAPGVILFRLTPSSPEVAAAIAVTALADPLTSWIGHFAVVDEERVHLKPLPDITHPPR